MDLIGPNKKRTNNTPPPATLPAPENLMTSALTDISLTLTWEASVGATSYDVYQDNVFLINVPGLTTNVIGLVTDTIYEYHVIARNGATVSPPSYWVKPRTDDNTIIYPAEVNIDTFAWGPYVYSTLNPIVQGTVAIDPLSGNDSVCINDNDFSRLVGSYSKTSVFNADDTLLKLYGVNPVTVADDNGVYIIPIATLTNTATWTFFPVDGGGRWSPKISNMIYSIWNYTTAPRDISFKMQIFPTNPYGSEILLHDFTATHNTIGWGYNEGNIDYNDKYLAITANKRGAYSGLPQELIVLDLDNCKAFPNSPSNIHSRMDIADDAILDWVSISPSGEFVVLSYFNEFTINPLSGKAIIVYHNTPGVPSINNSYSKSNINGVSIEGCAIFCESHAGLTLDINGHDCWVGFKQYDPRGSGFDSDNNVWIGGSLGYDNSTYLNCARLHDGRVQYLFRDTPDAPYSTRGLFGGYITGRATERQGWIYVMEGCCMDQSATIYNSSGRMSADMIAVKLDWTNNNLMEYYGRSFADRYWTVEASARMVPSRKGNMLHYHSQYMNTTLNARVPIYDRMGASWLLTAM